MTLVGTAFPAAERDALAPAGICKAMFEPNYPTLA